MRIRTLSALTVLLLPILSPGITVILDPGHGGSDRGAHYGKAKESELVLNIAKQVEQLLQKNPAFEVHLTRTTDTSLSLPARVQKAEKLNADLFISLHANAALDSRAKGAEFYFQNSIPPDEESLYLAHQENQLHQAEQSLKNETQDPSKKADVTAILEDLQRQSRLKNSFRFTRELTQTWSRQPEVSRSESRSVQKVSIKQAPFYVISNTKMPSVLVEIGFLSNPAEVQQLLRPDHQQELAQKIYRAVLAYKEKMDKPTAATLD